MTLFKALLLSALMASPLMAGAHEYDVGDLHVDHPWARATPPVAPTAAAYFIIHNKGAAADRLLGAETAAAGRVELHEHVHQDGLMKMQHVQAVEVPAHGEARFEPMGYHVMLFDLKQPLAEGERFPMTLHFEKAGDLKVEIAVQKDAPQAHGEHEHGAEHSH